MFPNPCCCGTTPCVLHQDNFDRADSTTIGSKWSEESSDWEIVSNELSITNQSNARIRFIETNASGESGYYSYSGALYLALEVTIRADTDGDEAEIVLDDPTSAVKTIIRFTFGSTPSIVIEIDGTEYLNNSFVTLAVDTDYTVRVFNSNTATTVGPIAVYVDGTIQMAFPGARNTGNTIYGVTYPTSFIEPFEVLLGTGACTGTITFDDLIFYHSGDGEKGCDDGLGCPTPNFVQFPPTDPITTTLDATISGLADNAGDGCNFSLLDGFYGNLAVTYTDRCTEGGFITPGNFYYEKTGLSIDIGCAVITKIRVKPTGVDVRATVEFLDNSNFVWGYMVGAQYGNRTPTNNFELEPDPDNALSVSGIKTGGGHLSYP